MTNPIDGRARDWAYMATFREEDLPVLYDMTRRIHETHDTSIIEDFNQKCELKLKVGSNEVVSLLSGIQIQSVNKSEDLMVNVGAEQCINLILGTSSTRWRYMLHGSAADPGIGDPTVFDTILEQYNIYLPENPIDMSGLLGWREAVGMKLFFGAIKPTCRIDTSNPGSSDPESTVIGEIGVTTTNAAGYILLNHSKFMKNRAFFNGPGASSGLTDDWQQMPNVIIFSVVIEFCPMA